MPRPIPTRIFHITPIANLAKICVDAEICSKNILIARGGVHDSIAYASIQSRRATKPVACEPRGVLHDYVPFYFAPRSPMLDTIRRGNVPNCLSLQQDIVHIESSVERIVGMGQKYVIFPINAALDFSNECHNTLTGLEQIDWSLFFESPLMGGYAKYYFSRPDPPKHVLRMEKRQAEFLVHERFPLSSVVRIGVMNEEKRVEVANLFLQHGVRLPVEVEPDWYF
jgi:hypothetical protein